MKNIIKLIAAVLFIVLFTADGNNAAYASSLVSDEDTAVYDAALGDESAGEDKNNDGNSEARQDADEGAFDTVPEGYEVYVDEQGQVYYIEKQPEETENEDTTDNNDAGQEILGESGLEAQDEKASKEETPESKTGKEKSSKESKPSYSEEDLRLLACLVYAEAGNQSYEGMLAVANVVLNRVKSSVYWHVNTIEEVIYDNKWGAVQFAVTVKNSKTGLSILDKAMKSYDTGVFSGKNPAAEKKAMARAIKAAKAALSGENNIGGYLCFRANNKSAADIKKKYPDYKIIGDHIFYRTK